MTEGQSGFSSVNLKQYWLTGKGAVKIRWGTDGDWTRCVRLVQKAAGADMTHEQVKGYCSKLHFMANGFYPGSSLNKKK